MWNNHKSYTLLRGLENDTILLEKMVKFFTKVDIHLPCNPAILLSREMNVCSPKTPVQNFTEALIISQTLEIAQMSINRTVNNLECSCNEILHSNKKTMNYWYNSMNKFPKQYTVQEAQYTHKHIWHDSIYMIKGPSCLWLEQNSSLS